MTSSISDTQHIPYFSTMFISSILEIELSDISLEYNLKAVEKLCLKIFHLQAHLDGYAAQLKFLSELQATTGTNISANLKSAIEKAHKHCMERIKHIQHILSSTEQELFSTAPLINSESLRFPLVTPPLLLNPTQMLTATPALVIKQSNHEMDTHLEALRPASEMSPSAPAMSSNSTPPKKKRLQKTTIHRVTAKNCEKVWLERGLGDFTLPVWLVQDIKTLQQSSSANKATIQKINEIWNDLEVNKVPVRTGKKFQSLVHLNLTKPDHEIAFYLSHSFAKQVREFNLSELSGKPLETLTTLQKTVNAAAESYDLDETVPAATTVVETNKTKKRKVNSEQSNGKHAKSEAA